MARAWAILILSAVAAAGYNPYADLLKKRGVAPTQHGISVFLEQFVPSAETPERIEALVRQLGGPDPDLREQAVRRLGGIPFLAGRAVREALVAGDPEVRRLCKRILLVHSRNNYLETLHAAFQTIRIDRLKGLTRIVLAALPYCDEQYLQRPAQRALAATSRSSDAALLKESLSSPEPNVQTGAIHALATLLKKRAAPDLLPLLEDETAHVRLAAAEALAGLGMRESLMPLARLLEAPDASVRLRSGSILTALTGYEFGFASYAAESERAEAANRWKTFLRAKGGTVPLRLPLRVQHEFLGRTLVCAINTKRLEEYGPNRKKTFTSGQLAVPWGCQGLPNGHRLVAVFSARIVVEYDAAGTEVWRSDILPGQPMSVDRLENGNTLIACSDSGKVVEVSPNRRIVWSVTLPGRPIDARRVAGDRTLIALYQGRRIVEVAVDGAVKWEVRGPGSPSTVQRLPNGNTVVAGLLRNGVVTEYDSRGKLVWKLEGLGTVYEAQRLPSGNTLVATARGVAEYHSTGKVVWRVDVGPCRVRRY